MKQQFEWKRVKNTWISRRPALPGVWRRKEGGFVVRGRAVDPRTGKVKEVWRSLPEATASEAKRCLEQERDRIRQGEISTPFEKVHFATYGVSLLQRKIESGDIKSAAGIEKWKGSLKRLIRSRLGDLYVHRILPSDISAWRTAAGKLIASGRYRPATMNTDLGVLRVIGKHARIDFNLMANWAEGISPFDSSQHRTYTREQPNSLTSPELRAFLERFLVDYPELFALAYLGFVTGLRPSSLRPLRRKGPTPDLLWEERLLLVRRSNSRGGHVKEGTKTGGDDEIQLPDEVISVLRWHVETQLRPGPQQQSDLLFPAELGGFLARSALDKPFKSTAMAIGLTKRISPRAMRRSFQDLAREARISDIVTRSISGHATEAMQRRYSTVRGQEQADGMAKIVRLIDYRERAIGPSSGAARSPEPATGRRAAGSSRKTARIAPGGDQGGDQRPPGGDHGETAR